MRILLAALSVILLVGAATAQPGFRITHELGRTTPTQVEVKGTVFNESRAEATDVSVTAEAVDAGGKVLARGISYVSSRIPEHGSAGFVAKVPAMPGAATYRVSVTSYRFVPSLQGP